MKSLKMFRATIFIILLFGIFNGTALSVPSASFLYSETNLGGGSWQYDYTLYNTSIDLGFDLYEVAIDFSTSATFTVVSLPSGWDANTGSGFIDTFSLNQGTPPDGTDIAPGASLSGFSFQLDYQAGNLPFLAYLTDPNNPDPFSFIGNTAAAVPEPATLFLLVGGLAGLSYFRKKRLFRY